MMTELSFFGWTITLKTTATIQILPDHAGVTWIIIFCTWKLKCLLLRQTSYKTHTSLSNNVKIVLEILKIATLLLIFWLLNLNLAFSHWNPNTLKKWRWNDIPLSAKYLCGARSDPSGVDWVLSGDLRADPSLALFLLYCHEWQATPFSNQQNSDTDSVLSIIYV